MDLELVDLYIDRFVSRTDCYARQRMINDSFSYITEFNPVTLELIEAHLLGTVTLAFPPFGRDGLCKWVVWDSDKEDGHLAAITNVLRDFEFDVIREGKREGREGHLWLLLDKPLLASHLIRFDAEIRAHAGVPPRGLEFFPKQNELSELKMPNPIRGPLSIHRKPGAGGSRGWFEGPEYNLVSQLKWLAEQPLNSAQRIASIVTRLIAKDTFLDQFRFTCSKAKGDEVSPEVVFAELDPVCMGTYYICLISDNMNCRLATVCFSTP